MQAAGVRSAPRACASWVVPDTALAAPTPAQRTRTSRFLPSSHRQASPVLVALPFTVHLSTP